MPVHHLLGPGGDLSDAGPSLVRRVELNARWGSGPVQRLHQVPDALTANSHRGNHRHSQLPLQSGDIDLDAFFDRHIPEVEGHNRGHSPLQYL